jgi:hypothetical protein
MCSRLDLTIRTPTQRGFARHSETLAPMTVKNIPITIMIPAQAMTWIVTMVRSEILVRISYLSTRNALSIPCAVSSIAFSSNG